MLQLMRCDVASWRGGVPPPPPPPGPAGAAAAAVGRARAPRLLGGLHPAPAHALRRRELARRRPAATATTRTRRGGRGAGLRDEDVDVLREGRDVLDVGAVRLDVVDEHQLR